MADAGSSKKRHRVRMRLRDVNQLLNSMDPAPFHEKDLDADAEEVLVSRVADLPMRGPR